MTLPPIVRIFFAIDLPGSAKEMLAKYIGSLKKRSKSHDIRWSRPENLHITLQFLAEVQSKHLATMIENVRLSLEKAIVNAELTLGSLQLFPSPYRPRVIVLDIAPQQPLASLAGLIGEGIQASGYEIEQRPFRAHLTLGRIKHAQDVDLHFLAEFKAPPMEQISVNEVVLFRSEPQQNGSRYSILEKIYLNAKVANQGDKVIALKQ